MPNHIDIRTQVDSDGFMVLVDGIASSHHNTLATAIEARDRLLRDHAESAARRERYFKLEKERVWYKRARSVHR